VRTECPTFEDSTDNNWHVARRGWYRFTTTSRPDTCACNRRRTGIQPRPRLPGQPAAARSAPLGV